LFGQQHVDRYRHTDGEEGHDRQGTTVLRLTTTGRNSGAKRTTPLIYQRHGDDYLVVASNERFPILFGALSQGPSGPGGVETERRIVIVPLTLRNPEEDLQALGSNFDGAPNLEFFLATGALERVALTNQTIIDRDRLRQEIERVREQGCAIVDQEREQGMRSAAAPIRDVTNQVVAAINVSVLAASTPIGVPPKEYLVALLRVAAAIEADLASDSPHAGAR
jgi:hypothetical protein